MVRKVKCKYCEREITNDKAFRFINNKEKPIYYCNEAEFIESLKQKSNREEIYKLMSDLLRYEFLTPIWKKCMNEFIEKYNSEIVRETILKFKNNIVYGLNKNFENEFIKMRYIKAIIENNIEPIKKSIEILKTRDEKIKNETLTTNELYDTGAICDLSKIKSNILEFLKDSDVN